MHYILYTDCVKYKYLFDFISMEYGKTNVKTFRTIIYAHPGTIFEYEIAIGYDFFCYIILYVNSFPKNLPI